MKELTARQKEVLDFIGTYISQHKFPPTIREISEFFGISAKSAHDHIRAMERKKILRFTKNQSRTIEILDGSGSRDEGLLRIPLVGTVAAGRPIFAEENLEGYMWISARQLKEGEYFALRVKGDSMTGAGILDGDAAIIFRQNTARDGDIVVALINDENATLKRFFLEKNRIRLEAENPAYNPIYEQNVSILGRLACIIRSYE
jgi:repressor LexA